MISSNFSDAILMKLKSKNASVNLLVPSHRNTVNPENPPPLTKYNPNPNPKQGFDEPFLDDVTE